MTELEILHIYEGMDEDNRTYCIIFYKDDVLKSIEIYIDTHELFNKSYTSLGHYISENEHLFYDVMLSNKHKLKNSELDIITDNDIKMKLTIMLRLQNIEFIYK